MKIDTITFTIPYPKNKVKILNTTEKEYETIFYAMPPEIAAPSQYTDTKRGFNGYRSSFVHDETGLRVSVTFGNERQKIMYSLDGDCIRSFEAQEGNTLKTLYQNMLDNRASVTRCDIALDYVNTEYTVESIMEMERKAETKAYRTVPKVYSRDTSAGMIPETVYYGSPSSDMRLRIYDKAQEYRDKDKALPASAETWIRAEMQFRADKAAQVFRMYMQNNTNAILSVFKSFLDIPLWGATEYAVLEPKARNEDTVTWLLEVCAPSLARIAAHDKSILDKFKQTVDAELNVLVTKQQLARTKNEPL
jgi:hypothetical protein